MASPQEKISQNRNSVNHFHCIKSDQIRNYINRGELEGKITNEDGALIRSFIAELESCHNIGTLRSLKIASTLTNWRKFVKPFKELTITDVYTGISTLKQGDSAKGTAFKANTIYDYVRILKPFCLWMIENGHSTLPEKKIKNLKVPQRDAMTKTASDLLTVEEVNAMVKTSWRSMDRALIMMLYEGGFRIGEIGLMKWSDLVFDGRGVIVNVNFKTEKPRYIRLIMSKQYLAQWKHDYPADPEVPGMLVFLNVRNKPFTHAAVYKQLLRIGERAGISKHITPHIFRHSRITHLIRDKMPESVIKLMMWGNITTNQFQTYAHLTGENIDDAVMEYYGIKGEAKETQGLNKMEPVQCPVCKMINPPFSGFCCGCGMQFTEEAIEEYERVKQVMNNNTMAVRDYFDEKHKVTSTHSLANGVETAKIPR
jgi:site-specific recombinase XerD